MTHKYIYTFKIQSFFYRPSSLDNNIYVHVWTLKYENREKKETAVTLVKERNGEDYDPRHLVYTQDVSFDIEKNLVDREDDEMPFFLSLKGPTCWVNTLKEYTEKSGLTGLESICRGRSERLELLMDCAAYEQFMPHNMDEKPSLNYTPKTTNKLVSSW